jgi:hypothetical protein
MNDTTAGTTDQVSEKEWEWAIVEIFGHRRHVGKAREEERFGAKMLRIDVPKIEANAELSWSSHFYGGASIFSFTLTDEKTVMRYAEREYTPAIPYRDHGIEADESDDQDDDYVS